MVLMNDSIKRAVDGILSDAEKHRQPGMAAFAAFEDKLEAAFDNFHLGRMTVPQLRKFLLANGYDKRMAKAEIKQQLSVCNFKTDAKRRENEPL